MSVAEEHKLENDLEEVVQVKDDDERRQIALLLLVSIFITADESLILEGSKLVPTFLIRFKCVIIEFFTNTDLAIMAKSASET